MKAPLVDTYGRLHRSLRLSVTDRCNFRCPYCMPARDVVFQPRQEILSYEEFEVLVRVGVGLGVREVRITGGEPLLRRDIDRLVRRLVLIEGLEDVSLTTNGFYLKDQANRLKEAGLRRINVSLDTLRRDRFQALTGVDGLPGLLEGLDAAEAAGLSPIKINSVLMRGVNDDEILDFMEWARRKCLSFRFIELMPIGGGPFRGPEHMVPGAEVKAKIQERYTLRLRLDVDPAAPARVYGFSDGRGEVGFINAVTEPFCADCDRLRITADGKIRNCLFDEGELDLRGPLRSGATPAELEALWRAAVRNKGAGGCLDLTPFLEGQPARKMWQIGG